MHRCAAPQGTDLPLSMPIASFDPSDLPQLSAQLLENLKLAGHEAPTPLQRHVVPVALAGRDALIVGAGRDSQAASLLLPVVARLMLDPRALPAKSGGLRAVVLAPTREAASRTVQEARQLVLRTPLRCTLACGGTPLDETLAELSAGVELLVATPGRLVDLVERGRAVLGGVKVLALLEVDRLLDLGFEPQLRRLLLLQGLPSAHERQTLLGCAVKPPDLQRRLPELARGDMVQVRVTGSAAVHAGCRNVLVEQRVVYAEERDKQPELGKLVRRTGEGLTVVVCSTRRRCEMVAYLLQGEGLTALVQPDRLKPKEREAALQACATGANPDPEPDPPDPNANSNPDPNPNPNPDQAFATGASRVLLVCDAGLAELNLPGLLPGLGGRVSHVVGFDLPASMDDYAARVACTARGGRTGLLSTLIGENESKEALVQLMGLLRASDSEVPRWLEGQATLSHSAPLPSAVAAGGW